MKFLCEYDEPYSGHIYGVELYAPDRQNCTNLIARLDLSVRVLSAIENEKGGQQHRIHTWAAKSQKAFLKQLPRVLHHVCFVAHIASRWTHSPHTGLLMSDTGIVHSIAHVLVIGIEPEIELEVRRDVLVAKIASYERHVPFMWPSDERHL